MKNIAKFFYASYETELNLVYKILGVKISVKKSPVKVKSLTKEIRKLVKKVSKKYKNGEKIKVYFVIYEKSQWTFQSLYDALDKDAHFEPCVLVFQAWVRNVADENRNVNQDLIDFVENLNLRYVTYLDENNLPDIMFTTMPSYVQANVPLDVRKLYNKVLFCFHIYGWLLTDDDRVYFGDKNFAHFWKEYVPSPRDYAAAKKLGPTKGENVVCSGYLKNDSFYNASKSCKLWKNENTKKIIWAPHYSLYPGGHSLATFDRYYDKIYNYLLNHPEIEMILKPHPLLRRFIGDKDYHSQFNNAKITFMDLKGYDEYIEKWNNLPNGSVMDSGGYYELFNSADAMILDSESFVAEFMIQNKPICFCNKYEKIDSIKSFMNQMGQDLLDSVTIAQNWDDVELFIQNLLNNVDDKKEDRTKRIKQYLSVNKTGVGEFIKNDIEKSLNKLL